MTNYPTRHHRRSLRLQGYDYTKAGVYFVTICTQGRESLFGEIVGGEMRLNDAGKIAERRWLDIPQHFPHVELDGFVMMPNHIHGIVMIAGPVGATHASPLPHQGQQSRSIGAVVGSFKSAVSKPLNALRNTPGSPVWQRNFHEHIIRNDESLSRIREYIANNPLQWALDRENPANVRRQG